jgi:DNA-directed RNA polymerase specialized sigma24 family protein
MTPLFSPGRNTLEREMCAVLAAMAGSSMHSSEWEGWRLRWNAADGNRPEVLRQARAGLEAWAPCYEGWRKRALPADEQPRHTNYQPAGEPPRIPPRPYHRMSDASLCVLVRVGDERALVYLLGRHWRYVRGMVRGFYVHADDMPAEWTKESVTRKWFEPASKPLLRYYLRVGPSSSSHRTLVAFWLAAMDFRHDGGCSFRGWAYKRAKARVFNDIRNSKRKKHNPRAMRLEANRYLESESPQGNFIARTSSDTAAVVDRRLHDAHDFPGDPLRHILDSDGEAELRARLTPRQQAALDVLLNGERQSNADKKALRRARRKFSK